MTDLINNVDELIKSDINSVQELVNKYASVLQDTKPEKDIPYLAYIINICVNYINTNHKDLPQDWKAWSVVVVRNLYFDGKIKMGDDILKIIDDFLTFWKAEYKSYCQDIIAASEYDRDRGFMYRFLNKKIGSH